MDLDAYTSFCLDSPYSSFCLLPDMLPECRLLNCRCGSVGDGDDMRIFLNVLGDTVQCDVCEEFSHVACQRENIQDMDNFICDGCNLQQYFKYNSPQARQRRFVTRIKRFKLPLNSRLCPGQGALARHANFWYPVRLIRKVGANSWTVQWWRENEYDADGLKPGQVSNVMIEDITDSMWMDREGRRAIRLGRWKHPHKVANIDDIISDPTSVLYTAPINDILSSHRRTLSLLLFDPSQISKEQVIPAKSWLEDTKQPLLSTLVPYAGLLSIPERAQISNWFERHIGKETSTRRYWLGCLPLAHAFTIYIAARLKTEDPERYQDFSNDAMLEEAWLVQFSQNLPLSVNVDVDKECLDRLEEEMFEVSSRAGVAGHYQWGLDAGSHQNWCPYLGLPGYLNRGDYERVGDEEELQPGPNFKSIDPAQTDISIDEKLPVVSTMSKPRPKPRRIKKASNLVASSIP